MRVLRTAQLLPRSLDEVFDFFSQPGNLESITPDSLRFSIRTPQPIVMREGTTIDYQLRLGPVPLRWTSGITVWEPPHRFVDIQQRGPYRTWHHEHRFSAVEEGTLIEDVVHYDHLGGALVHGLFVAPQLKRIFGHRHDAIASQFGELRREPVSIGKTSAAHPDFAGTNQGAVS